MDTKVYNSLRKISSMNKRAGLWEDLAHIVQEFKLEHLLPWSKASVPEPTKPIDPQLRWGRSWRPFGDRAVYRYNPSFNSYVAASTGEPREPRSYYRPRGARVLTTERPANLIRTFNTEDFGFYPTPQNGHRKPPFRFTDSHYGKGYGDLEQRIVRELREWDAKYRPKSYPKEQD